MLDFTNVEMGATDLADGTYDGIIDAVEIKKTKAGNGHYLNVKMKLGQAGILFEKINIDNPNEKAVDIAQKTVKSILAYGVDGASLKFNTLEGLADYMTGVPVRIKYENKEPENGYARHSLSFRPVDMKATKTTAPTAQY
jgi:hypothetical protein